MTTQKDDGGAAFPVVWPDSAAPNVGMSLRDYFAAQVASGALAAGIYWKEVAEISYEIADAMLEARKEHQP